MKKWSIIIASVLVAIWFVVDTVRDFFANETIHYFSANPHHVLYVAAIAVAGGSLIFAFDRLSRPAQRHVRLLAWGGGASFLTMWVGYMTFWLPSLSSLFIDPTSRAWLVVVLLLMSGIGAYFWFEFYRTWKTKSPQPTNRQSP